MNNEKLKSIIADTPTEHIHPDFIEKWTSIAALVEYNITLTERQTALIVSTHANANFRKQQLPLED